MITARNSKSARNLPLKGQLSGSPTTTGLPAYKLHLGCGTQHLAGWTNCDLYDGPGVDFAFDLQEAWPFSDNSVEAVIASHVLEHVPNFRPFFEELWRVCRPLSSIQIRTPFGGCRAAWSDVTHVRPWYPESYCFLQPGYGETVYNMQHINQKCFFDVVLTQVVLSPEASRWYKHALIRKALARFLLHFPNSFAETIAYLTPLKSEEQINQFLATRKGNIVPLQYVFTVNGKRKVFADNNWIGWTRE